MLCYCFCIDDCDKTLIKPAIMRHVLNTTTEKNRKAMVGNAAEKQVDSNSANNGMTVTKTNLMVFCYT